MATEVPGRRARRQGWRTFVVLLLSTPALASDHLDGQTAGVGGASIAHLRTNSSINLNPSVLAMTDRYDVQALFIGGPTRGLRWGLSAIDARTNEHLAFGLSYHGGITRPPFLPDEYPGWALTGTEPENRKQRHDLTFALGASFLERRLGLGLNGQLSFRNQTYGGRYTTGNMDFALAGAPVEYVSLAFVARDVLPVAEQVDDPATLSLGVRGGVEDIVTASAEVDYRLEHVVTSGWDARAGLEGSIAKVVHLRAGWDYEGDTALHAVHWGLGVYSFAGSIDYAMRVPANQPDLVFGDVTHWISITVYTKFLRGDTDDPEASPVKWPDGWE